ncbi:MAG: hypothetical protein ACXAC7_12870 [Candidatus Hodarchaeales archaeon]|jgi:hypothetical protein
MKINGDIKKNSLLALLAGSILTIIVVSSIFVLPGIIPISNPTEEEEPPNESLKLGARIAKYMNERASEVVFGWCYNNTFVNLNITELIGDYADGFLVYGAPINDSTINMSVLHVSGVDTGDINTEDFISVVDSFETALNELNNVSTEITDWMDIWPPTFLWDIAYEDGTSLSLVYSQEKQVIAAVNGTWTTSEFGLAGGVIIEFPNFEYNWEDYDNRKYFELDENSNQLVITAMERFLELIGQIYQ